MYYLGYVVTLYCYKQVGGLSVVSSLVQADNTKEVNAIPNK
jgi:hypothetical protein